MLVSLDDSQLLTRENAAIDAVAWKDGKFYTKNEGWAVDSSDPNFYYFAAAITGFENENGVISERAKQNLYFRAYIEFKNTACHEEKILLNKSEGTFYT